MTTIHPIDTEATLTSRQRQILDFVRQSIEEEGRPPSYRDIARHCRIRWVRAVQKHIQALEKKGFIEKGTGHRALDVKHRAVGRSLPIVGMVAAGRPILAEENIEGALTVDPALTKGRDCFLLRVKGESMKDAAILNGDLVLVKPQPEANPGEVVVALINGEATVKRFAKEGNAVVLKPENSQFRPIVVNEHDDFRFIGKVVGVFRI